jgi:hypothetical protein
VSVAPASRSLSSTEQLAAKHLSTKVEDFLDLVENVVDAAHIRAYLPTSALLLRPVDG